jgi:hypothetical protein
MCRRLVCATNAQLVAEKHLIRTFWPIWNSETKTCWGMSKHGDAGPRCPRGGTEANAHRESAQGKGREQREMSQEFDLTPDPRVLQMLGEINLPQWRCLAELIDNSIDGFVHAVRSRAPVDAPEIGVALPMDSVLPKKFVEEIRDPRLGAVTDQFICAEPINLVSRKAQLAVSRPHIGIDLQ